MMSVVSETFQQRSLGIVYIRKHIDKGEPYVLRKTWIEV